MLVLYHGTPVGGFNEFRNPLNFFTPNRAYAERYANQDSKTGEIYEVYLNAEKPFDIKNPEDRQIFIDEYVKGGWSYSINPSLSDKEIAARIKDGIDWTEADNLKEFLEENDYDYDGLILNEGGDFEYGDRDNSYVIFESRQAKRVDNENPTRDADIRFSIDVPEEESKTLIAIHNLSTDEMMKSLDLGGFPMPSIAITKAELGHNQYGNISVLFGKDTIDPRLSRNNKVYSGDAYTPEFPTVNHKINSNEIVRVRNTVRELVGDVYDAFQNPGLDTDNAEDKLDRSRGSYVDAYGSNEMLEYAFAKSKGEDIELPMREMPLSYKFDNDEIKYIALMFPKEEAINRMNGSYQGYEEALKDGTVDKIIDKLNSFEKKKYKSKKAYDKLHTTELPFADYDSLIRAIEMYNELLHRRPAYKTELKEEIKGLNDKVNENIVELLTTSEMIPFGKEAPDTNGKHKHLGIKSFDNRTVRLADDGNSYRLDLTIANLEDGSKVAYAKKYIEPDPILRKKIEEMDRSKSPNATSSTNSITSGKKKSTTTSRNSIDVDTTGRELSEGQKEFLKWTVKY